MATEGASEREYVLMAAREKDVKFVRLWFTDILGNLKGFAIDVKDLEDAIEQGVGFDGSAIEGFARIHESDMRAFPDPSTFTLLPWRPQQNAVARMFCNIRGPRGEPFVGDPRYVLKRNLDRVAQLGFTYYAGTELEFFYFKTLMPQNPWTTVGISTSSPAGLPVTCDEIPCLTWQIWASQSNTLIMRLPTASTRLT